MRIASVPRKGFLFLRYSFLPDSLSLQVAFPVFVLPWASLLVLLSSVFDSFFLGRLLRLEFQIPCRLSVIPPFFSAFGGILS